MGSHTFTLGIEEEFQIIDPETRELRSHIQEILADGKMRPERTASNRRCTNRSSSSAPRFATTSRDARQQVLDLRSELAASRRSGGLKIASAGTHPFSHWMDQLITADERYATIVNDMQQIARANLIFGLHVHVGIPDREEGDPHHEPGALFPAAHLRALGQLAFLARPKHRFQSLSANDL